MSTIKEDNNLKKKKNRKHCTIWQKSRACPHHITECEHIKHQNQTTSLKTIQ